jgi:hypothetical protein
VRAHAGRLVAHVAVEAHGAADECGEGEPCGSPQQVIGHGGLGKAVVAGILRNWRRTGNPQATLRNRFTSGARHWVPAFAWTTVFGNPDPLPKPEFRIPDP